MNPVKRFLPSYTTLTEEEAEQLSKPIGGWYTVQVKTSPDADHPETLNKFIKGITELQTSWLGLKNTSPTGVFEIRRPTPENIQIQFSVPSRRLERKVRSQIKSELDGIQLTEGTDQIPVTEGDSVGGGILTTGRRDWYPLQTSFDEPPTNSVVGSLHRHAMQDTQVVIQVLFKPVAGKPLRRWYRNRRTYQRIGYLRKEKEKLWNNRPPTPREKRQADAVERKAGTTRFYTSIRLLFINSKEYTPSRVKELAGSFNIYENPDTGQYLNAVTIQTLQNRILDFASTIQERRFGSWHRRFHASTEELAALVSIPDRSQQNIPDSKP